MRIAVVGCGIAGLASALVLARLGNDVRIFERFPQAKPLGAGLLLQPTGQEVLARLGLLDRAVANGARIERLHGRTVSGRTVLEISYPKYGPGAFGLGLHRVTLFTLLHDAVRDLRIAIKLGCQVEEIEEPETPRLVCSNGHAFGPFDLVIVAEGAHSVLRERMLADAKAPVYPWGALWAVCLDHEGHFAGALRQVYGSSKIMIGVLPIGDREVAFFWSIERHRFEEWRRSDLTAWKRQVVALWPETNALLERVTDHGDFSEATYRDVVLRRWHRGRVLFIGDAAHGTSPQLGQGANLALIDALVLGHVVAEFDGDNRRVSEMLRVFERLRRSQTTFYRVASRLLTPVFQSNSRLIGWTRDLALGTISKLPVTGAAMRRTLVGRAQTSLRAWRLPVVKREGTDP